MATTFLEPGGDATFNVTSTTNGGLWGVIGVGPAVATDFVHGSHIKSIKYRPGFADNARAPSGIVSASGGRLSIYIYIVTLPTATATLFSFTSSGNRNVTVRLTSAGVLQLWNTQTAQIGVNGSTIVTGKWYRFSLALTEASTSINEFRFFKDGVLDISVTNATMTNATPTDFRVGNDTNDATLDFRSSDHYVDNSSSLTDTGDIWVTAKRPNANGTTNGFTTQIGSGGSGYGTGHSPQVNERPLSTTNGWSMVGAGSAVTEEYNIEGTSVGDFNLTNFKLVDYMGWAYMKSLAGETVQFILNGVNTAQAITSTNTMYTLAAGSSTYPAGTGTDIGITTDTSLTTVSLYECGIMVAFIMPAQNTSSAFFDFMGPAQGYNNG